ncbi:serpin family protein [Kitasatospora sp. NBC_01266]|uniref:serpin family protein n=1 Tax=Kitasatospora sp. NBC_01266 TaxID=2903572 RepID=UPI002E32CDDC|nr:serpin family protein [Kitasatospora sp. NBC_01266]
MNRRTGRATTGAAALAAVAAVTGLLALAACGSTPAPGAAATGELRLSVTAPPTAPPAADLSAAATATDAFGLDLLHALTGPNSGGAGEANTVLSPSGLATALAMLLPGARGGTAQELATVLHTGLPPARYVAAMGAAGRAVQPGGPNQKAGQAPVLKQSDTVWTQRGYPVQQAYLQTLAQAFQAGLRTADFVKDPDTARQAVNALVEQQTDGRIKNLLPPGSVDPSTVLVLTDALYLKAAWAHPFEHADTADRPFHRLDGSTASVSTMAETGTLRYAQGGTADQPWQAVELPYAGGGLVMDLVVPGQGSFDRFRAGLDGPGLDRMLAGLSDTEVDLTLPRFDFGTANNLTEALTALGLHSAFVPTADFSGIPGPGAAQPYLSTVVQQADITVDESGTTAAAGTAVGIAGAAAPQRGGAATLHIDRPFLFLIRDVGSGQPLFLGQVTDPAR